MGTSYVSVKVEYSDIKKGTKVLARISKKNRRFRTKEKICRDLSIILRNESRLSYGTQFAVLYEVIWVWSEFDGKHKGCKHWSKKALKAQSEGRSMTELIHEHLVPRKLLIKELFEMSDPSSKKIYEYLNEYCIGVIITKDEDSKLNNAGLRSEMPKNWDGHPWARYKEVGIVVERIN